MVKPTKLYCKEAKHVLRYLRGTTQFGFWYIHTEGVKLQGFTDADWARSPSFKKIISGGIFSVGSAIVSWYNRKHISVELNSAKVEYMVAIQATCKAIWMRKVLVVLFGQMIDPRVIYCDNECCIKFSHNPVFHD